MASHPTPIGSLTTGVHEAYERLAPSFGYTTREDTRKFDPTSANGQLMMAACAHVRAHVDAQRPGKVLTDEEVGKLNAPVNLDYGTLTDKERTYLTLIGEAIHEAYRAGIRYARDNGYLAPAQPLSVDKIMEVYHEHERWFNLHGGTPAKRSGNFKARLNKLIG